MPPVAAANHRFLNVDGLRLLCALAVLLFHYCFKGSLDGLYKPLLAWPAVTDAFKYGHIGVHIFFCISGFVIAYSAAGRSAMQFAAARFSRIYPTFLLCLVLLFAARWQWGGQVFPASLPQLAANFTFVPQLFGQSFLSGVYWSIVVELSFYAWVFVLILVGVFDRHRIVIVALWLAISTVNELALGSSALRLAFITEFAPYFAFGVLLQLAQAERRLTLETGGLLAWAVALAILVLMRETADIRAAHAIALSDEVSAGVLLAGLFVLVWCVETRWHLVAPRVLLWAGGVSYPLYLLHEGLGQVAFVRLRGEADGLLLSAAVTMGVLVIATLVWLCFDRWAVPATRRALELPMIRRAPQMARI
jgi:peptidoglycan/LPS O-acetylase OafA/YrhL